MGDAVGKKLNYLRKSTRVLNITEDGLKLPPQTILLASVHFSSTTSHVYTRSGKSTKNFARSLTDVRDPLP
ncbi:unnamed protein product, partial [Mesorhabditis belari]|uniref:Uncharacterized protein n=1 Tax=Mesorhabditis belari TaxID=2138241 RepID=A0AAF3J8L5_9BILA